MPLFGIEFRLQQARLALETRQKFLFLQKSRMEHLESPVTVLGGVIGLVHSHHAALSQLLDDAVWTDRVTNAE